MQEEHYANLLAKSAAETKAASARRDKGLSHKPRNIFTAIRKQNIHDEEIIIVKFAALVGMSKEEFIGYNNSAPIANARHLLIYTLCRKLNMSLHQAGSIVRRDHSTVGSSIKRAEAILKENPSFNSVVDNILKESKRQNQQEE